jgi:hypothetical protein
LVSKEVLEDGSVESPDELENERRIRFAMNVSPRDLEIYLEILTPGLQHSN